jgi:hypothetical protein
MAERYTFPFVRKVLMVSIALWTVGCASMFWSMHNSSRRLVVFFLILYAVPTAAIFGVFTISWWYARKEPPPPAPKRRIKASNKGKKA